MLFNVNEPNDRNHVTSEENEREKERPPERKETETKRYIYSESTARTGRINRETEIEMVDSGGKSENVCAQRDGERERETLYPSRMFVNPESPN